MTSTADRLRCTPIVYDSPDYAATLALRDAVLRNPLGLSLVPDQLQAESRDFHLAAFQSGRLVACLILTPLSAGTVRMRQVAVVPDCQRQGIGTALVRFAEKFAWARGYTEVMAHARESALLFYMKLGYVVEGAKFTELGIPHVEVRKRKDGKPSGANLQASG